MLVKRIRENCGKLFFAVTAFFVVLSAGGFVQAQNFGAIESQFSSTTEGNQCGAGSGITYNAFLETLPKGDFYIRTNANNLKTVINVHVEDISTGSCKKIGQVLANDSSLTRVGKITQENAGSEKSIILSSKKLGADIYASVATVLIVDNNLCVPQNNACVARFMGEKGAVEPTTISAPGEFVTVQAAPNIAQEDVLYVEYYDNGEFLYASESLEPVNRSYLQGGTREVKKAVYLSNNNLFTVTETIKMPKDPLYSQYIKSRFYRLGGQARFVAVAGLVLGLAGLGIFVVRRIHRWRTYRNGHGIEHYLRSHHKK